jgi:hypothetical protein
MFTGFLKHGFLFCLKRLYDIRVFHQFVSGGFGVAVSRGFGGSDQVAGPGADEPHLHLGQTAKLRFAVWVGRFWSGFFLNGIQFHHVSEHTGSF